MTGPVFAKAITDWAPHLERMYEFWDAVLFNVPGFKGNPFAKHALLPINTAHFERWIKLFTETIDAHFCGPMANEAKQRAGLMATMFMSKLDRMRNNPGRTIV